MGILLSEELKAAGYEGDPEEFRVLIVDLFHGLYPSWTDEELTCHPLDAHQYCNLVRYRSTLPNASDRLIMRCLINWRKSRRKKKSKA